MRNKDKLTFGLVFAIVLVVTGTYFILQSFGTPALTVTNQNNSATGDNQAKVTNNQTNKVTGEKTNNQTSNQNTNPNERVYKGKTYKIFSELTAVGPHDVVCPYCGGTALLLGDAEEVGEYWYYYYHCGSCGANIAEKALNH